MPVSTALKATKRAWVRSAISRASVVLPVPGRSPEDQRLQHVALDRLAQRRARREHGLLADDLVEGARAHPLGQRRIRAGRGAGGGGVVVEEAWAGHDAMMPECHALENNHVAEGAMAAKARWNVMCHRPSAEFD